MKHKNFLYVLFSLTGLLMFVCGYAYEVDRYNALKFGAFNPTGGQTYYLQSSISSTQTTITLSSFEEPSSNIPYTMSYLNSTIEYATINPQGSPKEFVSFTGITQNSDGSATLTGVLRGLEFSYPYQASTTLAQPFAGQTRFILSNPPQLYTSYAALANNNVLYGINTFSSTSPPRLDEPGAQASGSYIATTSEFATVLYVNNVALSGAPNAAQTVKGLVQLGTALQVASSTALGSTGAALVLQSANSTDTPTIGCAVGYTGTVGAGCNIVADLTGHIWKSIVGNLSIQNLWTAINTFTSSTTMNATTTIAASSTVANALRLNGINYAFPAVQGASSTMLQTNGSGQLSWGNVPRYNLIKSDSLNISSGYATSSALFIPAGVMGASSTISVAAEGECLSGTSVTCVYTLRDLTGKILSQCNISIGDMDDTFGNMSFVVGNQTSLSSQKGNSNCLFVGPSNGFDSRLTSGSLNTANAFSLVMVVQMIGTGDVLLNNYSIIVNP